MNPLMGNAELTLSLGWLIGFMEGEGSFSLTRQIYRDQKPSLRPRIVLCSTDFELIDRAEKIVRGYGIEPYILDRKYMNDKIKDMRKLHVGGIQRCRKFLEITIPHMTPSRKRITAETLLAYCEVRMSKPRRSPYEEEEYALGEKMRNLNSKGASNIAWAKSADGIFSGRVSVTTIS